MGSGSIFDNQGKLNNFASPIAHPFGEVSSHSITVHCRVVEIA